jgi:multimeric flavodoxin WrbA
MRRLTGLLEDHGVEAEIVRPVDYAIKFGITSDEGEDDEWPRLLEKIKAADILLVGMSIWFGHRSSVCQMVIERLDGTYEERNEQGRARGAPTTCSTWRGSSSTIRSHPRATRWRSTAGTPCIRDNPRR